MFRQYHEFYSLQSALVQYHGLFEDAKVRYYSVIKDDLEHFYLQNYLNCTPFIPKRSGPVGSGIIILDPDKLVRKVRDSTGSGFTTLIYVGLISPSFIAFRSFLS